MSDISKISVNGISYDLKDANARQQITELIGKLGLLSEKNEASGLYTPSGTVTAPTINVSPATTLIKNVSSVGSTATWSANVNEEVLSFEFDGGSVPSLTNVTVVTGINDATASIPIFKGEQATITVS